MSATQDWGKGEEEEEEEEEKEEEEEEEEVVVEEGTRETPLKAGNVIL